MRADADIVGAVADAHRREWAFVLAATVRVTGDIDLAEECVQDAYTRALDTWGARGVPSSPGAWLTTVARRRAVDLLRRRATAERLLPVLASGAARPGDVDIEPDRHDDAGDDRLRLIFTCCHPALAPEARVALTLRLVCGLTTVEVARAFLVTDTTMAARLTRAKKKIAVARIPYRVPAPTEIASRISAVLDVVHLLFTTGHTAPAGTVLVRRDLTERALDLARLLRVLLPDDAGVAGLLGLILLTDARRSTRLTDAGSLQLLADQDRAHWDREEIDEGRGLAREAVRARPLSRFALMAAIAAVHAEAASWEETDWAEIVGLYDVLSTVWPSPVVALNRAVAVGYADGPAAGLRDLDELASEPQLVAYAYTAATRADFLRRLGRTGEACDAYSEALLLTENEVERQFLRMRIEQLAFTQR